MSTYGLELEGASAGRRLSRGAKIGLVTVGAVVGIRIVVGNLVINDWEGWGTFLVVATTLLVEGLVLGGLVFGLLVRLAARSRNPRPAVAALITGVLSVLSFAISYSAHQAILGAGAVALGLAAIDPAGDRRGSRWMASAAIVVGLFTIAAWLSFVAFAIFTDDWPTLL